MGINEVEKQKMKALMHEVLVSRGWTEGNDDIIIRSLPEIWDKLVGSGLLTRAIMDGLDYPTFEGIARRFYFISQMRKNARTQ